MVLDQHGWSGWSNSKCKPTEPHVYDMSDAVEKIKHNRGLGWRIIDADNLKLYVSDAEHAESGIKSAKVNFGVDIPAENIFIGFPKI